MRNKKEIKEDLLTALELAGDSVLAGFGFKRRRGSLNYIRDLGDTKQTLAFGGDYLPKYQSNAELCFHPAMHLEMKSVSDCALDLVGGDKWLLANSPEIIVNQPIEFTAPKTEHVYWDANGIDQMVNQIGKIIVFIKKWVLPFLDVLQTPADLIEVYTSKDGRMMKGHHWYLFVAAAQLTRGNQNAALAVIEENLGSLGMRRRYATAFEKLAVK